MVKFQAVARAHNVYDAMPKDEDAKATFHGDHGVRLKLTLGRMTVASLVLLVRFLVTGPLGSAPPASDRA